ncbi:hypothetical protein EVAR_99067_1 [Eumeta japonica]|uniref:Uncharacterized protein n=1 Tax=Eumeta variegata TaxID=151549 RepID=A0A4C1SMF5_EUMVA|nr:hypothetical protein EVAR_99067_1 [Eumeta japonica]
MRSRCVICTLNHRSRMLSYCLLAMIVSNPRLPTDHRGEPKPSIWIKIVGDYASAVGHLKVLQTHGWTNRRRKISDRISSVRIEVVVGLERVRAPELACLK